MLALSFSGCDPQQTSHRLLSSSEKVLELPICSDAPGGSGLFRPLVPSFENCNGLFQKMSNFDQTIVRAAR
jgi:hypothetical protein